MTVLCPKCNHKCKNIQGWRNHTSRMHEEFSNQLKQALKDNNLNLEQLYEWAKLFCSRPPDRPPDPDPGSAQTFIPQQSVSQFVADSRDTSSPTIASIPATPPPINDEHQSTLHICPECQQSFDSSLGLTRHMQSHPVAANNIRRDQINQGLGLPTTSANPTDQPTARQNRRNRRNRRNKKASTDDDLQDECEEWIEKFEAILDELNSTGYFDQNRFNTEVGELSKFLAAATNRLSGPKHPATKHYNRRQQNKNKPKPGYKNSSNPARKTKAQKQKAKERYDYELCQYQFHYRRRVLAQKAMSSKDERKLCPIPMDSVEQHYATIFGQPNDQTRDHYPSQNPAEDIIITPEEIAEATHGINSDNSPGWDKVLIITVKRLNISRVISAIANIMLITGSVPPTFTQGRMILIPKKGGDPHVISNWRPINIYSIIRRIIERALNFILTSQVELDMNQRGFRKDLPGCQINARLVNACLLQAKREKSDCTMVFLDIAKAFDRVGHAHIEKCLLSLGVSTNLNKLIMALLRFNTIRINIGQNNSEPFQVKCSVPQGSPLSPTLFSIAINYIYKDVCEAQFAEQYGFKLDGCEPLALTGFADDQVVSAMTVEGARRIVERTTDLFREIGLEVNPRKSSGISIAKGRMNPGQLALSDGASITCIDDNTEIRYLGCTFKSELVFDLSIADKLTAQLNNILNFPHAHGDQKLTLINQYLLPQLTYQLQAAPINKIPIAILNRLDVSIRATARGCVGLPKSTNNGMLYAHRKYRGLGVMRLTHEVQLQHFSVAKRLLAVQDATLQRVYNFQGEMDQCRAALNIDTEMPVRRMRNLLREREFDHWKNTSQGIGIEHFRTYPPANQFVSNRGALSGEEWTAALKLNSNYANLKGVPGNTATGKSQEAQGPRDTLCRGCGGETETPSHVLGSCSFNSHFRIYRHNKVKHTIRALLEEKGLTCVDEAQAKDDNGANRFIDILAFDPTSNKAYLIDPSVRYESNHDVEAEVDADKRRIYERCIDSFKERYAHMGARDYEVIPLWFGARGSISRQVIEFFERFKLEKKKMVDIAQEVLVDSLRMIHRAAHV